MTQRTRDEELKTIEWLLGQRVENQSYEQPYGDLVQLNTSRVVAGAIPQGILREIVDDYLDLLGTSAAVYEKNGDYALGIFSSGWCRFMDAASHRLCGTSDSRQALDSGRWLCHESCWNEASRPSMESGQPVDIACQGGIRLYAVPIRAGEKIVGSINFGYGDPPKDPRQLQELAGRYDVAVEELQQHGQSYQSRPSFIVDLAKRRLQTAARLIGEIIEGKHAEEKARKLNEELERRVAERTAELQASIRELEAFAYSVSHDLRAPLRSIDGFSRILLEDFAGQLPAEAQRYLNLVREDAQQMGRLIEDLLAFSRLGRAALDKRRVLPGELVRQALRELHTEINGRRVEIQVGDLPPCEADPALLLRVYVNLLSNALKFTRQREGARIEVGYADEAYFVADNGAGFDMRYVGKLFGVFQRLHTVEEYEGTGVGLAIVRRAVHRHGGSVWAEGTPGQGATFYFTLEGKKLT